MWITKRGCAYLEKKIKNLETQLRTNLKKLGEQAEQDFDLPENPIWKQLQVEIGYNLPKQISELKEAISQAQIIEDELSSQLDNNSKVQLGSKVRIRFEDEDYDRIFILVGPFDTDVIANSISYLSPLGRVLLGSEINDEKCFIAPKGKRSFVVLSIEKGL